METLEIVNKVSEKIVKDNNTSIVTNFVTYSITGDTNQVLIGAGLQAIMPNAFELQVDNCWTIQHKLQKVLTEINNISFNDPGVVKCPGCGEYLYHQGKFTACMNVDCVISDNNDIATLAKMAILAPGIPLEIMTCLINDAKEAGFPPTVTSIIAYAKSILPKGKRRYSFFGDKDLKLDIIVYERVISETKAITITKLFNATVGPFPENYRQIVYFYNDSIISMSADFDSVFAPLHELMVTTDIRILLSTIMNSNRMLLSHILE